MKLSIIFLLIFNSFLFSQIKEDAVVLSELDLDKASLENLNNYRKKLNKNKLNLSYHIKFSGVFHRKDKDSITFTGTAKYKNDLFLNNIHFGENIKKEDKSTLHKFFNQIYNLAYTYYSFSQDKNSILNNFYCIQNGDNQWNFKINKQAKEKLATNISNKINFEILLDNEGMVRQIFTFSDTSNGFNKNGKVSSSHYIEIHLSRIDKEYKMKHIKGNILNPSTNEKIIFNISFE
jgi:hypothetical protein